MINKEFSEINWLENLYIYNLFFFCFIFCFGNKTWTCERVFFFVEWFVRLHKIAYYVTLMHVKFNRGNMASSPIHVLKNKLESSQVIVFPHIIEIRNLGWDLFKKKPIKKWILILVCLGKFSLIPSLEHVLKFVKCAQFDAPSHPHHM